MGFAALANVPTFGLAQILLFGGSAETVAMPASRRRRRRSFLHAHRATEDGT